MSLGFGAKRIGRAGRSLFCVAPKATRRAIDLLSLKGLAVALRRAEGARRAENIARRWQLSRSDVASRSKGRQNSIHRIQRPDHCLTAP